MKIAFVHDWLVARRGGENVLAAMLRHFPGAPIFTLVHSPGSVGEDIEAGHRIHTSVVQKLPGSPQHFRRYLPLFFSAIEGFDLRSFDVVVSTSHCVAKGVRTDPGQFHLSYIHTPMRYLWDQLPEYLPPPPWLPPIWRGRLDQLLSGLAGPGLWWWRRRDRLSAQRPSRLLANSAFVAGRIQNLWRRRATVVHPPVDTQRFTAGRAQRGRRFLVVSALVPYKRVDVAVQAACRLDLELDVVGDGSELPRLRTLAAAAGGRVRFLGRLGGDELDRLYGQARALLFPGVEDFGIVPVEAMASGCPVIALGIGGALETVVNGQTGIHYQPSGGHAVDDLCQAISRFAAMTFSTEALVQQARRFSVAEFDRAFLSHLDR